MAELIIKNDKGEILYRTSEAELLRLGRDRTNTFCIEDEHISLQHCEILWDPKRGASIRDNGSYNGTRILRKKGDGIIGITVGQRPYYEDRDAAHKYVSEYRLLENGDRIRLYSGCILTVEYNLSETVADEKPFDRVGDVGPAEKESKEIEAKEEPIKTNIYESKREPVYPKTVIDTDNSDLKQYRNEFEETGEIFERFKLKHIAHSDASDTDLYIGYPRMWCHESPYSGAVIKIFNVSKTDLNIENKECAAIMFEREMNIARQLDHPNIIKTYETGREVDFGNQYIIMEYCEGGDLVEYKKKNAILQMKEKDAIEIIIQILEGLKYIHTAKITYPDIYFKDEKAKKLVHRDIKPQNILVRINRDKSSTFVISDFGLAKDTERAGSSGITSNETSVRATYSFAPYEQILNPVYVKNGADIWSAFAVLFWLLTDQTPRDMSGFWKNGEKCSDPEGFFAQRKPRKIRDLNKNISNELANLIDDILAKDQSIPEYSGEEEQIIIDKLRGMLR